MSSRTSDQLAHDAIAVANAPGSEVLATGQRLAPGYTIGSKYEILELIGTGGMGAVYKAKHVLIGRTVAVKILHSNLTESQGYLERFRREALVASRLVHPNAITLFDFGIENACPYLVMQFVEGKTLKDAIIQEGSLPLERIGRILSQVGSALAEAHGLGIVHRDLKPDNIMLSVRPDGTEVACILDFGIAKPPSGIEGDSSLTMAGVLMGTPLYMSPEQALNQPYDARSDIYALGVILFEMITGEVPFRSDSPIQLLFKHIHEAPIPVRTLKPELQISSAISDVVARALEKDPANRYQTVGEFVHAFQSALKSDVAVTNGRPVVPNRHALNLVLFGSLIGVGLLGGAVYLLRSDTEGTTPAVEITPVEEKTPPSMVERETPEIAPPSIRAEEPAHVVEKDSELAPGLVVEFSPPSDSQVAPTTALVTASNATSEASEPVAAVVTEEESPAPLAPNESDVPPDTVEPAIVPVDPDASLSVTGIQDEFAKLGKRESKTEAERCYQQGTKLFEQSNYAEAAAEFRDALVARPSHLGARLSLGATLLRLGRIELAKEHFDLALSAQPDYPPTLYNLAAYHAHKREESRALEYLRKAINLYPKLRTWLTDDTDFDNLRSSETFQKLVEGK